MKQTSKLDNACGVIACLHSIFNNGTQIHVPADSALAKYFSEAKDMSPADRATHLEDFTAMKDENKSFASEGQSTMAANQSDVRHHFTAFVVNTAGQLIELDGMKAGPHVIAEVCSDVMRGAVAEIQRRLAAAEISESVSVMTLNAL